MTTTPSKLVLLLIVTLAAWALVRFREDVKRIVVRFFNTPRGPFNLAVTRVLFYVAVLVALPSRTVVESYAGLPSELLVAPNNGGWLLAQLPMNAGAVSIGYVVVLVSAILGLIGLFPRLASALFVVAAFYYLGVPQLYGKVDHIHHLLWIGAILAVSPSADVLSVQALWRAWRRTDTDRVDPLEPSLRYSLPLRFIWLALGLLYVSAGLAKYRFDGLEWLRPATLSYWLHLLWYQSGGYRPPLVTRPDQLTPVLVGGAAFTLAFETTFLLWIFIDRARPILAVAAIVFHNSTNFLMRIPFWTLQIIDLCLVDWERLSEAVFRGRHALRFVYDGNCGICKKTVVGLRALTPPGAIEFVNGLDRRALDRGGLSWLSEAAVVADVQVVTDGSALAGYDGYRRAARRVPALWPLLPLLYLPPVATVGRRVYRHVADGRSCALDQNATAAPASRATAAPIAAVGVPLIAILVALCVYSLRSGETSTRAMNGWPFATYPTFAGIGDGTTTQLVMETRTPVGRLAPLEFGRRLQFASAHRVVGLLGSIVEQPDRAKQERAMRALVRFARPTGRGAGETVHNVVIVRQRVSVSPESAGKVLESWTLLTMPTSTSGG